MVICGKILQYVSLHIKFFSVFGGHSILKNLTHMLRSEQIFKDCAGMVVGRFQQTYMGV